MSVFVYTAQIRFGTIDCPEIVLNIFPYHDTHAHFVADFRCELGVFFIPNPKGGTMKNMTASIGLADTIALLQSEGFSNASSSRIYHAIKVGHVDRPELDRSLRYRFSRKDLRAIRGYLSNVPTPGRRPAIHA